MPAAKNIIGQRFERLVVVALHSEGGKHGKRKFLCCCDCDTRKIVLGNNLTRGLSRSCGCLRRELAREKMRALCKEQTTHGQCGSPEYRCWVGMLQRCTNPKVRNWKNYGGRGIRIDDPRWLKFVNFFADMGVRPNGMSLDRIDNEKGYSKSNCRWATASEQNKNRRRSAVD